MALRIAVFLLLAATGAGLLAWRHGEVERAQREAAAETSRVRAWARSKTSAGVSVLPKRVPAADEGDLHELAELPGFDDYAMRCASCHVLPDPAAYPAKKWIGTVSRMREHIREAGVVPPEPAELEGAIRFLQAASDSLRR